MTEELFDVVDQHDNVLRQLPRSEVHARRLRHRAVHVFVFRPNGNLIIHRRTDQKEEFPSVWTSSCSGHVSAGEDYDHTAPRELQEELQIHSTELQRHYKFAPCPDTSWEFTVLYSTVSSQPVQPDPAEIAAVQELSLHEIASWLQNTPQDFSPAFRLLFHWYQNRGPATS
ncbi:MAG: NUDIX hydrolase [Planctomycetaceae bacterium]